MKPSSITFLTAIFSLIAFSAFVVTFPNGINIAEKHELVIKNPEITFYGGAKGNGSFVIYSSNSTINGENVSYMKFEGEGSFYFPSFLYTNGKAYCKKLNFNATGKMEINGKKSYGEYSIKIDGYAVINFSSLNISFFKGKEKLQDFLKNISIEENIEELTKLMDLLPISIDKFFYIEGNGSIDKGRENSSKFIFRGTGNYSYDKFIGTSYLIIKDKKFFEKENEIKIGAFFIPEKLIYIWAVAIAVFIASLFFKKELEFDKHFSTIPLILSLLFLALTFYIWEKQATIIFGMSFFHSIMNANLKTVIAIVFIIIPYMEIIALIEFPIKIAISSSFSSIGLHHIGKIIGICFAYPVAIWLGIKMLASLLNMVFLPLLRLI